MTWTTPKTWATDELLTAADLNTYLRDNLEFIYERPSVQVSLASFNHNTPSNWLTPTFTVEAWDTHAFHSTSSNTDRLTVPMDGKYLVTAHVTADSNAAGNRGLAFTLNGSTQTIVWRHKPGTGPQTFSGTFLYDLATGDYVTLNLYQSTGGSLTFTNISYELTFLSF